MRARLFLVLVLMICLSLVSTSVSAQGPTGAATPSFDGPPRPPQGYNPSNETTSVSDGVGRKLLPSTEISKSGTRAPRSPNTLGQPGFSLRYLQTFGQVEVPYFDDTTHINYPYAVSIDGTNVWIADSNGLRALKYTNAGAFVMQFGKAGFRYGVSNISLDWITDVAVYGGNIWLADGDVHQVFKLNSSGVYQSALGQSWTSGSDNAHFDSPRGLAFDSSGNLYVSDSNNNRVQIFNSSGTWLATIGGLGGPRHIAIDNSNLLYIADAGNHRVQIYNVSNVSSISFVATIGTSGISGTDTTHLNFPVGVAVDASKIYVADTDNHRVQIFDRNTRGYLSTIGTTGVPSSANGQFIYPTGVAVDSSGNIYVAEGSKNSRVQQFSSSLAYVRTYGTTGVPYLTDNYHYNQPAGIAVAADGSMYVVEARGHRLLKLNSAGVSQWTIGQAGIGYGSDNAGFNSPNGVALDNSGKVYVADTWNNRIQIYNSDGSYFGAVYSGSGTGCNQSNGAYGVAVNSTTYPGTTVVYVADSYNHRILVFGNTGSGFFCMNQLGQTGVSGSDNSHFNSPHDVAVDSAGNIYVADLYNHRVQKCVPNANVTSWTCATFAGVSGISGSDFSHLSNPIAVAVDSAQRIYVSDDWGYRVLVFDANGAFLTSIGNSGGNRSGQMHQIEGLASDKAGNLYGADLLNHRIQKLAVGVPGWAQTNINGFGDSSNYYVLALAPFGGQFYAGTFNPSSLSSGAQLWRSGSSWTLATTNGLGDSTNVGINDLMEFNGQLYAGTWNCRTWSGYNCVATNGGQIRRSSNGSSWNPVTLTGYDNSNGEVLRFAAFNNQIYASTVSYTSTHGAEIWRSPTGDSGSWTRVMSNGFDNDANADSVPAMVSYNGYLYATKANWNGMAEVWRCSTCDSGSSWSQVNMNGFDGSTTYTNTVALSLAAFNGYLYAGTRNWSSGGQLWRCSTCDSGSSWSQVIGPTGSVSSGFGKSANGRIEALQVYNNMLYAITYNNDGMEVWRTPNGTTWQQVGWGGFGNSNNYAAYYSNSVAVFNNNLYIGTLNDANDGQVWSLAKQLFLPLIKR
jgi:sugar lactone lactonase YvrE